MISHDYSYLDRIHKMVSGFILNFFTMLFNFRLSDNDLIHYVILDMFEQYMFSSIHTLSTIDVDTYLFTLLFSRSVV